MIRQVLARVPVDSGRCFLQARIFAERADRKEEAGYTR